MIEHHSWRQPSPLPIVDPLLEARLQIDSEELCEGGITAGRLNQAGGLGWVHDRNINTTFMDKSNEMFINGFNGLFSLEAMPEAPQEPPAKPIETPIDRFLRWAGWTGSDGERSLAAIAEDWGISPQNLNNWKRRGMPPYEIPRLAAKYEKPIEVALGALPENDQLRDELLAIWKVLLPGSKLDLIKQARYIRTIQNPIGETGPHPVLTDPNEKNTSQ